MLEVGAEVLEVGVGGCRGVGVRCRREVEVLEVGAGDVEVLEVGAKMLEVVAGGCRGVGGRCRGCRGVGGRCRGCRCGHDIQCWALGQGGLCSNIEHDVRCGTLSRGGLCSNIWPMGALLQH